MYLIHFLISLITIFYLAPKLSFNNHLYENNFQENIIKINNLDHLYLNEKYVNKNSKSIVFYAKFTFSYLRKYLLSAKNYKIIQLWANIPVGASALVQDSRGFRTLRMFQTHACDNNNLELKCPKNSAISIYSAHFGSLKSAQDPNKLCPHINLESNNINSLENTNGSLTCSSIHAFMIVDTKCKDNQFCTIPATISQFLKQPNLTLISEQEAYKKSTETIIGICSSEVTYAEVAYKCKPTSITSKGICENEKLHLTCPKRQVIHIYKAFYGSINEPYIAQCKSIDKTTRDINDNLLNEEECPVNNETEMLIKLCQGYRKCNLIANDETFNKTQIDFSLMNNSICKKNKRLKVLYTCTMPQILTDEYQSRFKASEFLGTTSAPFLNTKTDEIKSNEETSSENIKEISDGPINHFEILSSPVPKASKEKIDNSEEFDESCNCTSINPKKSTLGFVSEWIQAVYYMSGNQERLLLYFLVSVSFSLICILIVMSCRLRNGKKKIKRCMKQQLTSTLDYITNEEDENLMSVCNTPSHYKQLHRQNLMNNSLLNEANNNNFQRPFRNSENLVLINNSEPTTFYSQAISQKINCTPNSHVNPNYLHPFLNERELINTRSSFQEDDDDDDEDEEEPLEGGFNSSNSTTKNNDRQNLMVTTNKTFKPSTTKPIIIKNYASTMHFARFNPNKHQNEKFNSMNRATIAAILTNTRSQPNFLLPNEDKNDEDNYLILSSSPNLNPCQTFSTTSAGSHNTTLTTATTSLSSPSPKSLSLSQRATPPSNYRLRNQDSYSPLSHILITTLTTTLATTVETNSSSTFTNSTNTSQSPNKTLNFNTSLINNQNSLQNSSPKEIKKNIKKLNLTSSISDQNLKKPAWLDQPSPIKTNEKQKDIIVFENNKQTITNSDENN